MVTEEESLLAWLVTPTLRNGTTPVPRGSTIRARASVQAASALAGVRAMTSRAPTSSTSRAVAFVVRTPFMMTSFKVCLAFTHGIGGAAGGRHEHRFPTSQDGVPLA